MNKNMKEVMLLIAIFSPLMFGAFSCVSKYVPIAGLNASKTNYYRNQEEIFTKDDINSIASIVSQFLIGDGFKLTAQRDSANSVKREYVLHDSNRKLDIFCNVNIDKKSIGIAFLVYRENIRSVAVNEQIKGLNKKIKDGLRVEYKYLPVVVYPEEK